MIAVILYGEDYVDPPEFHKKILEIYNNNDPKQLVVAPVGFAKSLTIKTFLIKELLEGRNFQLLVCANHSQVTLQMSSFFKIFKNKIFKELFGYEIESQNETEIVLNFNGKKRVLFGKSVETEILGINFEGNRPHNIAIDDLENQEQVASSYRTDKLKSWLDNILIPRLVPFKYKGKIRWIGTNLGENSLVNQILTDKTKGWNHYKFTALDENDQSIFEELYPTTELITKRENEPINFAMNYMNEPLKDGDCLFSDQEIGYYDYVNWDDIDVFYSHSDCTHTAKTSSDYFCSGFAGKNKKDNKIYILDFILTKEKPPKEQRQYIIDLYKRLPKLKRGTFDMVGNDAFEQDTIDQAREQDVYLHKPKFEGLKYPNDKYTHIYRHEHLIKSKTVVFPRNHPQIYKAIKQLTSFSKENIKPNNRKADDFVDFLSGVLDNFHLPTSSAWAKKLFAK